MQPDTVSNIFKESIEEVSVLEVRKRQEEGACLIDIREKEDLAGGSPLGALRIPRDTLEAQIEQFVSDVNKEIYLLCEVGKLSVISAFSLKQLGYKNVYSVIGGYDEWRMKELPLETPQILNKSDYERYKRHLTIPEIGEKGQQKLLNSNVLIVGAGGIGSPIGWYLAASGIGNLGIIDDDVVDRTNLQRQILHTENSVGNSKVESAKKRMEALNSEINIKTYNKRLNAQNIESIIDGYDLVLDGTDNFTTRYLINDACVKLKIPNIHGSVFLFEGQVSTFWPASEIENAPCYRCVYPEPPPPELSPSCAEAGVLGVLPGMIGVMCATEAIKILAGFGDLMVGKLFRYDASTWQFDKYEVNKNPNCPYCGCTDMSKYPAYKDYSEYCEV